MNPKDVNDTECAGVTKDLKKSTSNKLKTGNIETSPMLTLSVKKKLAMAETFTKIRWIVQKHLLLDSLTQNLSMDGKKLSR